MALLSTADRFPKLHFLGSVLFLCIQAFALMLVFETLIATLVPLPDVDHAMHPFLHHRSILTHSILVPGCLALVLSRLWFMKPLCALFLAATAIHLLSDALSPSIGYGAVWLPPGANVSLGGASPWWLGVNGLVCAIAAIRVMNASWRTELVAAMFICAALYGLANEQSVASAAFIIGVLLICAGLAWAKGWLSQNPKVKFSALKVTRDDRLRNAKFHAETVAMKRKEAKLEAERIKAEASAAWARRSWFSRTFIRIGRMFRMIWYSLRAGVYVCLWAIQNPKKTLGSTAAIALVVVSLYFLGASVPETAEGVASATGRGALVALKTGAEAVGGGVWVLHSSGGYILNRGGKYVGGTLRSAPP